jgi:hypothetical protein
MTSSPNLDQMTPDQLRAFAAQLLSRVDSLGQQVDRMGKKNDRDQTIIEQLTHEIAWFKRNKFAKRSEQLSPAQDSLLDGLLDTDIAAIEAELKCVESAGCAGRTTQAAQACTLACAVSAFRDLSRTRQHPMPLRLPASAHRRRRQREAQLHAGRVYR